MSSGLPKYFFVASRLEFRHVPAVKLGLQGFISTTSVWLEMKLLPLLGKGYPSSMQYKYYLLRIKSNIS